MTPERQPLAVGNVYRFQGSLGNGFRITALSLPGTRSDDGGIPGVAIQWLNRSGGRSWYPLASEQDFWDCLLFRNACDPD